MPGSTSPAVLPGRGLGLGLALALALALTITIALTASLPSPTLATQPGYESDYSHLRVVVPPILKEFAGPSGFRHSQALFGVPSYGEKKIAGEIVYVTPEKDQTGCDLEKLPASLPAQPIFLVDRGDCDFVQKVQLAQKNGAKAVVIADNVCQCSTVRDATQSPAKGVTKELLGACLELGLKAVIQNRIPGGGTSLPCENGLPFMADDGTGGDVSIPSFLIDFYTAQSIKDCLASAADPNAKLMTGSAFKCAAGTKVIVSLEWDLPAKDNVVDFQLWSSSDSEGLFKRAFASTMSKLKSSVRFQPHYFLWDGEKWGCDKNNACATQCTDGGLYCNPDPDHSLFQGVSGKDVVEENLRELCVWQQAKAASGNVGEAWWDYVTKFAVTCHPGEVPDAKLYNSECSRKVHDLVPGLSWDATQKCVADSWDKDGKTNKLLAEELRLRQNMMILTLPTAVVNGVLLRGGVTTFSILTSICAGFQKDKRPALCACTDRASSDTLIDCINSACDDKHKLCTRDKQCYAETEFEAKCNGGNKPVCDPGQAYCKSLTACLPTAESCPSCPDATSPYYCGLTGKCVSSTLKCTVQIDDKPPVVVQSGGLSVAGGVGIALIVATAVGAALFMYMRRQRSQMHDDVRAILSSYLPLEEADDRLAQRQSSSAGSRARVAPVEGNGGGAGAGAGGRGHGDDDGDETEMDKLGGRGVSTV